MRYFKNFIFFLVLCACVACAAHDAERSTAEFVYNGKPIILRMDNEWNYNQTEKNKYGGKVVELDSTKLNGYDVWVGGFTLDNKFSEFGIFYFDGVGVVRAIDVPHGFFVYHKKDIYVSFIDMSDQHAAVSALYKLYVDDSDKIKAQMIYRFPGFIENFNTSRDHLLVSGGVNDNVFAAAIDQHGGWHQLHYVPPQELE